MLQRVVSVLVSKQRWRTAHSVGSSFSFPQRGWYVHTPRRFRSSYLQPPVSRACRFIRSARKHGRKHTRTCTATLATGSAPQTSVPGSPMMNSERRVGGNRTTAPLLNGVALVVPLTRRLLTPSRASMLGGARDRTRDAMSPGSRTAGGGRARGSY